MVSPAPATDAADPIADAVRRSYDENRNGIERARRARRYYYAYLTRVLRARITPGQQVLDIRCGWGRPPRGARAVVRRGHRSLDACDRGGAGARAPATLPRGGRRRPAAPRAGRRAVRRRHPRERGDPPERRPANPRAAPRSLPLPHRDSSSTATAALWHPVLRAAEMLGLKYQAATRILAAARGGAQHALARGLRGAARRQRRSSAPATSPSSPTSSTGSWGTCPVSSGSPSCTASSPAPRRTHPPTPARPTRARA